VRKSAILIGLVLPFLAAAARLTVTNPSPPPGSVDSAYSQTFQAAGGTAPYSWSVVDPVLLPSGLSLGTSGALTGTPDTPGTYIFGITVTDAKGLVGSASITLTITPAPLVFASRPILPRGITGIEYPTQVLDADGGVAPYTFALAGGSLPAGLSLVNGVIGGTPSTSGSFAPVISVTDSAGTVTSATFALTIRAASVDLTFSAAAVSFALSAAATAPPPARRIAVQSSDVTQRISYATSLNPAVSWLSVPSVGLTPGLLTVALNSASLALAAGSYSTTVVFTCTSPACNGLQQSIAIDLTVTAPPPRLAVRTQFLRFSATPSAPNPAAAGLTLENPGGGVLGINAITCGAPWCAVSGVPASLAAGPPVALVVSVNPSGLAPGLYQTSISISTSVRNASVPVNLRVSPGSIHLAPSGAQFTVNVGSYPGNSSGSFRLRAVSVNPVPWTAAIQPGADWLQLANTSGTVSPSQPASIGYSINPAIVIGLSAKTYFGSILVSSPGLVNSPREFCVVLTVSGQNVTVKPQPEPEGIVLATAPGSSPGPQTIQIFSSSKAQSAWSASATTANGGAWLSVSPTTGTASAGIPGTVSLTANAANLAAGIYRGEVSFAFSAAAVRSANVTLIVAAGAVTHLAPSLLPHASGCAPASLVATHTGLTGSFSSPVAWPVPLEVKVADDCGNAITNAQVVAVFSNNDPPLSMELSDPSSGAYTATWLPQKPGGQITITARASAPGLAATTVDVAGTITPNVQAPSLAPQGILHVFNPQTGGALAPGAIVQIYGSNLTAREIIPGALPLPPLFNNTAVLINGTPAPLYYISPGQINAQIPFELNGSNQYEVVVANNGLLTSPQTIDLAPVAPGIAEFDDGKVIAQHVDLSLVTPASPASPGEVIVVYLAGMGATAVPVASGVASPSSPPALPATPPVVTLNGVQAKVLFAGLTPTAVGLYQINLKIPDDATGDLKLVVTQAGISSNLTIVPVQ
jgi:uncharacterized protein (TIGR03437 family)